MTTPWRGSTRRSRLPSDWAQRRQRILERDAYLCQIRTDGCTMYATDVDHIIPVDDHSDGNLRSACGRCHRTKSASEGGTAAWQKRGRRQRPDERHPGLVR